tara:strand:+ start:807 stop:2090 length:1284 start_codon:yes stop_codon:yes gene_type:complete
MLNFITTALFMIVQNPISIWEAMETAEQKPSSISSQYLVLSAESDLEKSIMDWGPSISLNLNASRTDSLEGYSPQGLNFFGIGENFGTASLTLNYPLYSFGMKNSQIQIQKTNHLLSRLNQDFSLQQSRLAIANSWLNLWLAEKNYTLSLKKLENTQTVFTDAQARHSAQLLSDLELLQFESEFFDSEENMHQAQTAYQTALTIFKSLTGIETEVLLGELPEIDEKTLVSFMTNKKNERLNVKRAQLNLLLSKDSKNILENRPNLSFRTTATHPENEQGFESGDTLRSDLSLSWEILKTSKKMELKSASEKIKSAEFLHEQSLIDENALVESSLKTISMYETRINSAEKRLELMEKISLSIREGLNIGSSSYIDWSNSENNHFAAGVSLATVKVDFLKEIFNLSAGNIDSILNLKKTKPDLGIEDQE